MLGFFIAVLVGLALGKQSIRIDYALCVTLALTVVVTYFKKSVLSLFLIVLFGMSMGVWRGGSFSHQVDVYKQYEKQKLSYRLIANNDAVYGKNKQMTFDSGHLTAPSGQVLPGKIQTSGFGMNAVFQGDEILATGSLRKGFGSYQASMSFANLELIRHHPSLVAEFRRKFAAGIQSTLPEPAAPFAMGILIGQRATLPADVKQDFLMVGLTHIIAVSGYNLTIILNASQRVLGGRSKRIATFLTLSLILVFFLITGSSASIVRAAIVSVLSIWAGFYGRSFKPLNLIAFAAVITAWANPTYLWSDLSWYLSFLAFYGVMVLSPLFQKRWPAKWQEGLIGGVALESVCAEIMSLPFILFIFGQMSLIGLVANVLVVALVPLAMLLSLIAGLAGMFLGPVAGWFAWPARLLLNYMLDVAQFLASLPHIFIENRGISLMTMIGLYSLIVLLCIVLWRKTSPTKPVIITDEELQINEGVGV